MPLAVDTVFPTGSYWTEWSDCVTPSRFWCLGLFNRTRKCFIKEDEVIAWNALEKIIDGKDLLCGHVQYYKYKLNNKKTRESRLPFEILAKVLMLLVQFIKRDVIFPFVVNIT